MWKTLKFGGRCFHLQLVIFSHTLILRKMVRRKKFIILPKKLNKKQREKFYKYLDNIYLDAGSGGAYSSATKILKEVNRRNYYRNVTIHKIEKYLEGKPVQSLYRQTITKFRRPRVRVSTINSQFEVDLMDISRYASQNDKYHFILICIDALSKYTWGIGLRTKHGAAVANAMVKILDERSPDVITSDRGSEFKSLSFQNLLRERGIRHFFANSKASICERVIKSLRLKIARFMFHHKTETFIHDLSKIIGAYNKSYHRSIKMRPIDVNESNAHIAFDNLYGHEKLPPKRHYRYKKNDNVRISEIKSGFFTREYFERFSREIFTVVNRFRTDHINMYRVSDCSGTVLEGSFYEPELTKVNISRYPIESILDEKEEGGQKLVKVKYENHPVACAAWVPKSSITRL